MYKSINIENELLDHYKKPTLSTALNLFYVGLKISASVFVTISFIMICSRTYTKTNPSNTLLASTTTILNDFSDISTTSSDYFIGIKVEDPTYGEIQTLDDLPWDALAEPYKKQLFSIDTFTIADKSIDLSSYIVSWNIDNQYNFVGNDQLIMLNNTGVYAATVTISSKPPTNSIYTYDFTLAVKYVRREIRSLTNEDRETFFSAL